MSDQPRWHQTLTVANNLFAHAARPPACAGTWYPGDPEVLRQLVDGLLQMAPVRVAGGEVVGLIVPHAGYRYSGQVAASAYAQLRERPTDRVLLLGPDHDVYGRDPSVAHYHGFRTPLGEVPIDWEAVAALEGQLPLRRVLEDREHSLEVQLPFLQRVLGEFRVVPLMLGDQSLATADRLAKALGNIDARGSDLLVASSDLSHHHPYETAAALDGRVSDRIGQFDVEGLARDLARGRSEACGGGALLTAMLWARRIGAESAEVLGYANSGDVTGERGAVVGYLAAALTRRATSRKEFR
ncbi:MAG: AmmeMemoRadiSam system protein B [Anaerolineae bacterium]